MGTAGVQGPLWGARARDWAAYQEGTSRPLYEAVFAALGIGPGLWLLDAGCGAGLAARIAAERGAKVAGLDASEALIAIARERVPAGDFRVGEIEALPFPDARFDVVTGFNSFQFAADPVAALREARRVVRPGGRVAMVVWGRSADCEAMAVVGAIVKLLPPDPPAGTPAPPPIPMAEPGELEALMARAGLRPIVSAEVDCPWEYPDLDTALRAFHASAPLVRAVQHVGETVARQTLTAALAPYRQAAAAGEEGGYVLRNRFRYVIAAH